VTTLTPADRRIAAWEDSVEHEAWRADFINNETCQALAPVVAEGIAVHHYWTTTFRVWADGVLQRGLRYEVELHRHVIQRQLPHWLKAYGMAKALADTCNMGGYPVPRMAELQACAAEARRMFSGQDDPLRAFRGVRLKDLSDDGRVSVKFSFDA